MKKHIYLHTSDLSNIKFLKEDRCFESVPSYPIWECDKAHKNEYGRIFTKDNYYHIILGTLRQENCPWCKSSYCKIETTENKISDNHLNIFIQCQDCGSRGPIKIISKIEYANEICREHIHSFIKQKFETRLPWDENLNI